MRFPTSSAVAIAMATFSVACSAPSSVQRSTPPGTAIRILDATPNVTTPPVASNPTFRCEAHGGDGDHVPLTRQLVLEIDMTAPGTHPIQVVEVLWSMLLPDGGPLTGSLLKQPLTLVPGESQPLSYSRYVRGDELSPLDEGTRAPSQRSLRDIEISTRWRGSGDEQVTVQVVQVRWRSCFDAYEPGATPLGHAEPDSPSLDAAAIRDAIRGLRPRIMRCYERALKRDPKIEGVLTLQLRIAKDGTVARAKKLHQSTIKNQDVIKCALNRAQGWKFPRSKRGGAYTIKLPFNLTPR